jgi:aromatic-amino-acid transaminase
MKSNKRRLYLMSTVPNSPFADVSLAPADPILGIKQRFNADPNPRKVDLSVGVYQNEDGQTVLMSSVQEAQAQLLKQAAQAGYLPIDGEPPYVKHVQTLVFGGEAAALQAKRVVTVQSVGGTSALRYGADFLRRYHPRAKLYISDPSWENHRALFERAGFSVETYPYYSAAAHGLDFEGMRRAFESAAEGSVMLLHASCHNPTGIDLGADQWDAIIDAMRARRLIPFVDFAYQGLWRGLEEDAFAVRRMAEAGLCFLVATSCSKNFSLYRRRVGALSIVTASEDEARRVLSQIKTDIRTNNSNPPVEGAVMVNTVLSSPELRAVWETEVAAMRERMQAMREQFVALLEKRGLGGRFKHVLKQTGMFSYTGLSNENAARLEKEFGVYLLASGRICVAALNAKNLEYVVDSIAKVV